jgi:hypothetical protein
MTTFKVLRDDPITTIEIDNPNLDEAMAELVGLVRPGTKAVPVRGGKQFAAVFTVNSHVQERSGI